MSDGRPDQDDNVVPFPTPAVRPDVQRLMEKVARLSPEAQAALTEAAEIALLL